MKKAYVHNIKVKHCKKQRYYSGLKIMLFSRSSCNFTFTSNYNSEWKLVTFFVLIMFSQRKVIVGVVLPSSIPHANIPLFLWKTPNIKGTTVWKHQLLYAFSLRLEFCSDSKNLLWSLAFSAWIFASGSRNNLYGFALNLGNKKNYTTNVKYNRFTFRITKLQKPWTI